MSNMSNLDSIDDMLEIDDIVKAAFVKIVILVINQKNVCLNCLSIFITQIFCSLIFYFF